MSRSPLADLTTHLASGGSLLPGQATEAARILTGAETAAETKEAFLIALGNKGETVEEVTAFAQVFRELARDPGLHGVADRAIDIVGTGGDKSGSFNLSTCAALIVAAAGVPVCKHGNRSVTSQCGSADFLEALGVNLNADNDTLAGSMSGHNFAFFFAPSFHPAFKEIMPVRKAMAAAGQRSIFNILGPLINPARPAYQILGVFAETWVEPLAGVLHALGLKRGLVVHCRGANGHVFDELTCVGDNRVCGFGDWQGMDTVWRPEDFAMQRCPVADLKGGDTGRNLELLEALMQARAPQGLADSVILNAAAALWICEQVDSMEAGMAMARDILTGGKLQEWLAQLQSFYR